MTGCESKSERRGYHLLSSRHPALVSSVQLEKLLFVGLRTTGLILLYYSFSIGITFYQKWLIKVSSHEVILLEAIFCIWLSFYLVSSFSCAGLSIPPIRRDMPSLCEIYARVRNQVLGEGDVRHFSNYGVLVNKLEETGRNRRRKCP